MKFSPKTLSILKSFNTINPSIYISPGSILKTISPQKTIIASADIEDSFDEPFGIYDLNQFLSTMSLFNEPDFEFEENYVTISSGKSSVRYGFASSKMIVQPPDKNLELPDVVVEFELTEEVFSKTMQAANVLQLPNWTVVGDGKEVTIVVGDKKNSGGNQFEFVVGETDKEFDLVFKVENLKFMPNKYSVKISSKGISLFETEDGKLSYFIVTETR